MNLINRFKPKPDKGLPFLIFLSFLGTFISSRLLVYFLPNLFLTVRGNHIHHFAYGIFLLSILGFFTLTHDLSNKMRLRLAVFYGIALGLTYDEFAMWLELEDIYHSRTNYDAIITISLILLNIIYFTDFWKRWGNRLNKLLLILLWQTPKNTLKLFRR